MRKRKREMDEGSEEEKKKREQLVQIKSGDLCAQFVSYYYSPSVSRCVLCISMLQKAAVVIQKKCLISSK